MPFIECRDRLLAVRGLHARRHQYRVVGVVGRDLVSMFGRVAWLHWLRYR